MTIANSWGERALQHARQIATHIGPRGTTTPEEKQAADYAQRQMQQLGLTDVRVEKFNALTNGWLPLTIIFSIAVWSVFACWILFYLTQTRIIGALVAVGLCLVALIFLYLELTLRDHPLRRTARGGSGNAIGRVPPAGAIKQRVVLVSNLDTAPAAPVLKTPRRARLFRVVFYAGSLSLIGSVVLYLLGGLEVWDWAFVFAGIFGLIQSAVVIQSLRADHGPLTIGANHNASGIGTVLALAERLRSMPLQNTEVWVACCGSHIAGGNGLRDLINKRPSEMAAAWFIGFEGVGSGDRLVSIKREGWLRRAYHPAARELIARAAADRPDRSIETRSISRSTVIAPSLWRGYKSICLQVFGKTNDIPRLYNAADTADHLEVAALDAAHEFGWLLLQQIDRG